MTEVIIWDETIIDFIDLKTISITDHYLLNKMMKIYGTQSQNYNKKLCDHPYQLKVIFIDDTCFEVICNEILIRDSMCDVY